ncbi:hypothetical protein [Actinokineospora diospyrosa]|nr:hypothetical protein [Actinokineospora diospyrosa]
MSTTSRIALAAVAGAAAALVLGTPATATPTPTVYIATFPTLSQCTDAGNRAVAGGVFVDYDCRNGVAGYDLLGEPKTTGTYTDVYIATFGTNTACDNAGDNGDTPSPIAWVSHTCRSGFTGWDLLVSK